MLHCDVICVGHVYVCVRVCLRARARLQIRVSDGRRCMEGFPELVMLLVPGLIISFIDIYYFNFLSVLKTLCVQKIKRLSLAWTHFKTQGNTRESVVGSVIYKEYAHANAGADYGGKKAKGFNFRLSTKFKKKCLTFTVLRIQHLFEIIKLPECVKSA